MYKLKQNDFLRISFNLLFINNYKLNKHVYTSGNINRPIFKLLSTSKIIANTQKENDHAHNVLIKFSHYAKTTVDIQKLFYPSTGKLNSKIKLNPSQGKFEEFSHLIEAIESNVKLDPQSAIIYLNENMQNLSDEQLLELLLTLSAATSCNWCNMYYKLFSLLSWESIKRSQIWDVNKVLLLADIWYTLNIPLSQRYYLYSVQHLYNKIECLESYQFIQSFFYLNLCRNFYLSSQQPAIEKKIEEVMDIIHIEELGIVAMGLFKTKHIIKNETLLAKIVQILVQHKQRISDISLCAILKILKNSFTGFHPDHVELCSTLQTELKSEVMLRNHYSLIQLASVGNHLNFYNEILLDQIIGKLTNEIQTLRLKDLERITFVMMNFRTTRPMSSTSNFCQVVEQELLSCHRKSEIEYYFFSFLSCVYYLACIGWKNSVLISEALKLNDTSIAPDCKKNLIQKHARYHQLFELNMIMQIEGPQNYSGHKLSDYHLKSIFNEHLVKLLFKTSTEDSGNLKKVFRELNEILLALIRKEFMKTTSILPTSFLPDILFCTDGKGNLQPFPRSDFKFSQEEVKYVLKSLEHLNWYAIVLVGRTSFLLHSDCLRGVPYLKLRLLENIGYKVVLLRSELLDSELTRKNKAHLILRYLEKYLSKGWLKELQNNLKNISV